MDVVISNVSQLQSPVYAGPQRQSITSSEINAEFLQLKALNKHANLRLSPYPLDSKAFSSPACLFSIATSKGLYAAVIRTAAQSTSNQFAIALGTLASLRQTFTSGKAEDNFIAYAPQKTFDCAGRKPFIIKFATNDDKLVVAFEMGPVLVFDVNVFLNSNELPTPFVFPSEEYGYPRSLHPNPGDRPELVAVMRGLYGQDRGIYIELLDVVNNKTVGGWYSAGDVNAMPISISWSPRGKQLAIGTHKGELLLFAPENTSMNALKGHIPRSPDPALQEDVISSTTWLANSLFYVVYAAPQAVSAYDPDTIDTPELKHLIIQHDKNVQGEIALENPCMPFGAKRRHGTMNVVLKNWGKVKYLLFVGDGPSSDISAIGCVGDQWGNLALEDTSRPALPLTADMEESALFGLELDLTSGEPLDTSEQPGDDLPQLPPAPILMAYTSEGALVAWHVIAQSEGAYPGMVGTQDANMMSAQPTPPPAVAAQPISSSQPSFTQPQAAPAAPISQSPFGAPQPAGSFGASPSTALSFGGAAKPTFGAPSFGNVASPASVPAVGVSNGGGFSAFAGTKPSAFGGVPTTHNPFAAAATAARVQGTSSDPPAPTAFGPGTKPTFGQTSFGSTGPTFGQSGFGFGQPKPTPAAATSAGGGFSAFSNKPSSFGPQAPSQTLSTQSAQPTFGAASTPTSTLSSAPTSGQTSFGQPPHPAAATPTQVAPPTGGGGGFAAFAGKTASFGAPITTPPGSGDTPKPAPVAAPPQPSAFSAFSKPGTGAFGSFGVAKDSPFALAATGSSNSSAKDSVASLGFGKPSVFGSSGTGSGATTSSAATFGQTSALGFGVKPPAVEEKKESPSIAIPASGGFASFSSSGGFSSFAGKGTSPFANVLDGNKTLAKEDAAKNIFNTPSYKPSQSFSGTGLGRGLSKSNDDDDDEEPVKKEAFPEDEIDEKEPIKRDDAGVDFGSLGIGKPPGPSPSPLPKTLGSSLAPITPLKNDTVSEVSPSKTPATPSTHGLFSSPASSSVFATPATPAKDATPSPTPVQSPATPASGFGAFKPGSGFGAFGGTSIANAFSQTPATPRTNSPATPAQASGAMTPQPLFGQSSIFGGGGIFGQPSASDKSATPSTMSPFSAFANKPGTFGQNSKTKDQEEQKEALAVGESTSVTTESPSLLSRLGPTPAKSPSLLDRLGPPPTKSDDGEEDFDDDGEEVEFLDGEGEDDEDDEDEEYSSEQEYDPEEGEEDEEGNGDGEGNAGVINTIFGKFSTKALSEEPVSAFKLPVLPSKPESPKAVSEPPSLAPGPGITSLDKIPLKPLGGTPIRSSPLASNPPVTAGDESGIGSKPIQQKPAIDLSLPAKPMFSSFPMPSADPQKKPSLFTGFSATTTPSNPILAPNPLLTLKGVTLGPLPSPRDPTSDAKSSLPSTTSLSLPGKPSGDDSKQPPVSNSLGTPLQERISDVYSLVEHDLKQLAEDVKKIIQSRAILASPRGGRTVADLSIQDKWSLSDLVVFQQILRNFERETLTLKDSSLGVSKTFAELQSLQLQAEVKKEEMIRYARAAKDPEFKQMISIRGLGPEQEESQSKLRKQMQSVGDRIQLMEETFASQKKRLEMHQSGRFRIEAPTLDTINRTCRNIDVALEQRSAEVTRLATRVDELRLTSSNAEALPKSQARKEERAADAAYSRAADAALGAEHRAARLKTILSRARTEPLLTIASDAPPVQRLSPPAPTHIPAQSTVAPSLSTPFAFPMTPPPVLPAFDWPKEAPSPSPKESGSSSKRTSRHQSSVKLPTGNRETPSPSAKAAASFVWGELPDFIKKSQ